MRRFNLVRREDVSGVSGTGIVAQGIEFDNGKASMCWLGTYHTVENADNIHVLEKIHGHSGRSIIEWIDKEEE